jgi:hypothetical protein
VVAKVNPTPQPVVAKEPPDPRPVVVAKETPESRPVVVAKAPAAAAAVSRPVQPEPVVQAPLPPFAIVSAAPTNVILPQPEPRKSKGGKKGAAPAAVVQPGAVLASAYPIYGGLTAPSAPTLVTVEEPETTGKKKKRH